MNQSHRIEVTFPLLDETAEPQSKHERLARARALVVAQFGPSALVDLEVEHAPKSAARFSQELALRA